MTLLQHLKLNSFKLNKQQMENQYKINQVKLDFKLILIIILISGFFSNCATVKTDFSNKPKKEATIVYYLPESLIKIKVKTKVAVVYNSDKTIKDKPYIIEQSFLISTETIAETENLLSLNYNPNPFMSDEIKYSVNSKGLLESVKAITEDRTPEIISKIAEAPQIVFGVSDNTMMFTDNHPEIVKIKEFTSDFIIRASTISNSKKTNNWKILILNELDSSKLPKVVDAQFSIRTEEASSNEKAISLSTLVDNCCSSNTKVDGILTRPLKNISLKIESNIDTEDSSNTPTTIIAIADKTKLIVIPIKRTAFVKRTNKLEFQDGFILSNEIVKPSSVEGFVSIPIKIAKAVVSIPAELVQFKIDNTKRLDDLEKAKLGYEKSMLENQKFELTKQQEIEKVKLEIQKTDLSNNLELQKLKLELQNNLLEAQKKQLELQKALAEIKTLIEEKKLRK
ncbi:MAG: hypothetical protein ACOVP1_01080 [Bacteroidia bacterium]